MDIGATVNAIAGEQWNTIGQLYSAARAALTVCHYA